MLTALMGWFKSTLVIEPTSTEWAQALRASGYRPTFVRLPAETVRAIARSKGAY